MLVKLSENLDFGQIFDFAENYRKSCFWSIFLTNHNFGRNIWKISILVNIFEKSRFCSIFFRKCRFCYKYSKISILVNIFENLVIVQYLRKSWIWLKFSENLDSDQYFLKITSLLKIVAKSWFWTTLLKISILIKTFRKIWILLQFTFQFITDENFDFNQFC